MKTFYFNKGVSHMKNRNFIIGLAGVGFTLQAVTLICANGGGLKLGYVETFNAVSVLMLFASLFLSLLSQPCEAKRQAERDELNRDFDAVYRHISDVQRDISFDIKNVENELNRRSKK
jgi:hypothetical protein